MLNTNNEANDILAKRAARYAKTEKVDLSTNVVAEIVVVAVGREKMGIPIRQLAYIIETPDIALLPHMPSHLEGIVQYRGDIFSVLNIARWFSVEGQCNGRILATVEMGNRKLGILVDKVLGFQTVYDSDVAENMEQLVSSETHPIELITRNTIVVLDIARLFNHEEIIVNRTR